MRPTRSPSPFRFRPYTERRKAIAALGVLLLFMTGLMAYQWIALRNPSDLVRRDGEPSGSQTANTGLTPGKTNQAAPIAKPLPTRLYLPLAGHRRILRSYGWGYSPVFGDFRIHPGIDVEAAPGDSVFAAAEGKVLSVEQDPIDGVVVSLDHENGMITRYAGLGATTVKRGDRVKTGVSLGVVGSPGPAEAALGNILHFEVNLSGEPVDPTPYFRK